MAYGDVGGAVTELVITCKTPASGTVNIHAGDAVKLTGAYIVDNATTDEVGNLLDIARNVRAGKAR